MSKHLVFVVDDDAALRKLMSAMLKNQGYEVKAFENGQVCLENLDEPPSAIFLDLMMPVLDGVETLKKIKQVRPDIPVIMVTSVNDVETAVKVVKLGAYDYIIKPCEEARMITTLEKALEQTSLVNQVQHLQGELKGLHTTKGIVGKSRPLIDLLEKIEKVTDNRASVLIQGESGTGKELVARAIHYNSPWSKGLFVDINCGAIPETLQESELFGHKKGAFTGAVETRVGKLEAANGGTLFLDEVGEMSLNTQAKFLRFLQEKTFERVGENSKIHIDTRVISATNKDLKKAVSEGTFREDLYYRLAVFPVVVPPLRERKEDIGLLTMHFLKKFSKELGKEVQSIDPDALRVLQNFSWPGNIRQLENTIYQAIILSESGTIEASRLPAEVQENLPENPQPVTSEPSGQNDDELSLRLESPTNNPNATVHFPEEILPFEDVERLTLIDALKKTGGNIPQAAEKLGISRSTFYRMVKKHGVA